MSSETKYSLKAKLLVLSLAVFITCLAAEQIYRYVLFGADSFSFSKMNSIRPMGSAGLVEPADHPEIIYQLKPNLDTLFKLKPFKTNSRGLRDKEYPVTKPIGYSRICLVGDSYSMPAGVHIEDAYHSVLEDRLNSGNHPNGFEVINFAVGGYSLRQYLGVIRFKVDEYSPDMILVGFCPYNDHLPPDTAIYNQPYQVKPVENAFFHSYLWNRLTSKGRLDSHLEFTPAQTDYMKRVFRNMGTYSRVQKTPIVVVLLSYDFDAGYSEQLGSIVRESGLEFLDLSSAFTGDNPRQYWIYPVDVHPNAEAHRIFADELYQFLVGKKTASQQANH